MPRKVAFSGKKKKVQILQKRLKNSQKFMLSSGSRNPDEDGETTEDTEITEKKLMEQPTKSGRNKNVNRYNLHFYQETKRDLDMMRSLAFKPLIPAQSKDREIDLKYFEGYDFPLRPQWSYDMAKETLEQNENKYFREYLNKLKEEHLSRNQELSIFELNLETWRQLWRVLEISDILMVIVDVRYATLMFPPFLYEHIVNTLKKHVILVLNKVDLVEPVAVLAWQNFFEEKYPNMPIVMFATFPKERKTTQKGAKAYQRSMEGVNHIYKICQKLVQKEVDLSSWKQKIIEDMQQPLNDAAEIEISSGINTESQDAAACKNKMYANGILTLGCIGFPNVGKSSLINALKGRKVVSVSRTPGHTKHFQTIFLTPQVRLCDCPGLVFPSSTPKYIQVLMGSYPISQLQVPYRSLKFLAEHLDLPKLLKLQIPEDYEEWCGAAIADAWALKRGFLTAKAARPDRYRAANHILRLCLAGQQQLVLQFYPPEFEQQKEKLQQHSQLEFIKRFQQIDLHNQDVDNSSVNSDTEFSDYEQTSSYDETNADDNDSESEEEESDELVTPKTRNAFALLEDD